MNSLGVVLLVITLFSMLLLAIGPAFVGYGVALLLRGRHNPRQPVCARCRAPLTRAALAAANAHAAAHDPAYACPSCGSTPLLPTASHQRAVTRGVLFIVLPIVAWISTVVVVFVGIAISD
jgi:DNA-directed RNA polymerase subunit RPC12/RpoP